MYLLKLTFSRDYFLVLRTHPQMIKLTEKLTFLFLLVIIKCHPFTYHSPAKSHYVFILSIF